MACYDAIFDRIQFEGEGGPVRVQSTRPATLQIECAAIHYKQLAQWRTLTMLIPSLLIF